jgi:hypothetical protein
VSDRSEANGARWPSRSSKPVAARVRAGWVRLPGASAITAGGEVTPRAARAGGLEVAEPVPEAQEWQAAGDERDNG